MAKTKVLITVKTYPAISTTYEELVCTAGFKEDGTWIRIYPVQFRKKSYNEQYSKWQWVEIDLVKNSKDSRPESYRPISHDTPITIVGGIKADGNSWDERRKIALKKVYTNKRILIEEAKNKDIATSLAVFKPTKIVDFKAETVSAEWDKDKLESLKQMNLFEMNSERKMEVVKKLPYKFSYIFLDDEGESSTLMIEDWEIGQLYWRQLAKYEGNEAKAVADVRKKYIDEFAATRDLHLFLGTTKTNHFRAPNPFIIIGTFHPKHQSQLRMELF
jgi:hypothetical protein